MINRARPFLSFAALIATAFPAAADTLYLFAGERVQNPARPAAIQRFIIDTKKPAGATPAPAGGLSAGLWGGTGKPEFQGVEFAGMAIGPNGDIYAISASARKLFRIDGMTGALKNVVLSDLQGPEGVAIDDAGNIYITDGDRILRCSPDGAPLPGAEQLGFVFTRGGSLRTASGLTVGPDGNLYVCNQNGGRIERYDGVTGEYLGLFHRGEISIPAAIAFGPDGNLYVACVGGPGFNAESGSVVKLNGKTGDYINTFAPQAKGALGLAFGPSGNLFVSNYWTGKIYEYDAKTGAALGVTVETSPGTAFYSVVFGTQGQNGQLKPYAPKTKGGATR